MIVIAVILNTIALGLIIWCVHRNRKATENLELRLKIIKEYIETRDYMLAFEPRSPSGARYTPESEDPQA